MMNLLAAKHVHIVGIGGAGMSPLAAILLSMDKRVSGSDLHLSAVTASLAGRGAIIYEGHHPDNIDGCDLVVITSAAREDNPEIQAARRLGVPVVKGSQLLGALMDDRRGIAVAGTHGKTTTTAMIAFILEQAGLDPTFVVGGDVRDLGASGKLGGGKYLVAEADEYDERFLQLRPFVAVVTNIEADHLDFYKNMENLRHAFSRFVKAIVPGGWLVACGDNDLARRLLEERCAGNLGIWQTLNGTCVGSVLYGLDTQVDYQAGNLVANELGGYDFSVRHGDEDLGRFRLIIPGRHNVQNATAAIAVANILGITTDVVRETLAAFHGVARRFDILGEANGIIVIDDYAHHPSEIKATLAAARGRYGQRRIIAVHQPHTYSRLHNLLHEFAGAFDDADVVLICDIYASRESDTLGMHSRDLVAVMSHRNVCYAGSLDRASEMLLRMLQPGDVLITLGAGDVNRVGREVLHSLTVARSGSFHG